MSETQTPEKTIPTSISQKPNSKPNRKTPTVISVSSSTLLLSLVSLSLLSFSLLFLSFKDTTFWFFLSNSLILFIAAVHSNTLTPSKPKPDVYDEYLKSMKSRNTYSNAYSHTYSNAYCTTEALDSSCSRRVRGHDVKETVTSPETETVSEKRVSADTGRVTEKRELVCCSVTEKPVGEKEKRELVRRSVTEKPVRERKKKELVCRSVTEKPVREKYARSDTEKAIVVVGGGKKKALRRSETEVGGGRAEEGDLSAMSKEELNRRVEEFIRRFNREIRLQEMREYTENL